MTAQITICTIDGCDRPVKVKTRGICNLHYRRLQRHGDPLGGGRRRGETESVLRDLLQVDHDECVIWPYARSGHGYGTVTFQGRSMTPSRAMCILDKGEPPAPGMEAAHTCGGGHRGCVNRNHLYWATHKDNYYDRVAHYGGQRGEKHGRAKLTCEAVRLIRNEYDKGCRDVEIAAKYNVSRQAVSAIAHRRTWKWLD